jgi:5-deoxy-glucuronate isomerase
MVFRKTNAQTGRHLAVTPANSAMLHLSYGRIILNAAQPSLYFSNGAQETGMICLAGSGTVKIAGNEYNFGQFDAIYIPRDSAIEVSTKTTVDFAEFSADVEGNYPLKVVRYADVAKDPGLKFVAGGPGSRRELNVLIANNVEAGRLIAGFTSSDPGNWTSWPPHEHAKMLEEMYVYFDMPEPAYGLQLVYNDTQYPELVTAVRDGDAVLVPSGYHPNVSVPGHRIAFLWAMAAHREVEDRQFGLVNIQPGFQQIGSGLDAARK